jgi:asparagine synthase (glutamine-hydrolysing)
MKKNVQIGQEYAKDILTDEDCSQLSVIQKITALTLISYTQNQLLRDIDAVSMAHSLEVRVPYLDHHLVQRAFFLPDETKLGDIHKISSDNQSYRATGTKKILIDACRGLLPEDIDLQEKRGFGMPFETWLDGPLKDVIEDTLSPDSIQRRGFFDINSVEVIKRRFYQGKSSWAQIWLLMIIELWCREVIDKIPLHKDINSRRGNE